MVANRQRLIETNDNAFLVIIYVAAALTPYEQQTNNATNCMLLFLFTLKNVISL